MLNVYDIALARVLTDEERQIIRLRYIEGWQWVDVITDLNISMTSGHEKRNKAIKKLVDVLHGTNLLN